MTEFNPGNYTSYNALPPDVRGGYRPVEDGFVAVTALDLDEAASVAFVENNIQMSAEHLTAISTELLEKVAFIDTHGSKMALNDLAVQGFAKQRQQALAQLDIIDRFGNEVPNMIDRYGISVPIDQQFVEGLVAAAAQRGVDREFGELGAQYNEMDAVDLLYRQLLARNDAAERERIARTPIIIPISQDRQVTLLTDTKQLGVSIPMKTDYHEVPVSIGPEAVTTILGAPLTDNDYLAIAEAAQQLPGEIGEVCRSYSTATIHWAEGRASGIDDEEIVDLFVARKKAADVLWKHFDSFMNGPINGIVVNALYVQALRQFPSLNHVRSPQPFED